MTRKLLRAHLHVRSYVGMVSMTLCESESKRDYLPAMSMATTCA